MYKNIYDTHSHSVNSPDGAVPVDDFCRIAISRGMSGITISDHYDICDPYTDDFPARFEASRRDTYNAKNKYGDVLNIAFGIELGQPLYDPAAAEEALSHNYDIVIASLHILPGPRDFYYLDYTGMDLHSLIDEYLDDLIDIVRWNRFDTLAHINYPLRYMPLENHSAFFCEFQDKLDLIYRTLISNGKALEVNCSGLRQKIKTTLPDTVQIKRYLELGGELITIGTDSHRTEHIGACFRETMEMLNSLGIKYYSYYKENRPVFIPIE